MCWGFSSALPVEPPLLLNDESSQEDDSVSESDTLETLRLVCDLIHSFYGGPKCGDEPDEVKVQYAIGHLNLLDLAERSNNELVELTFLLAQALQEFGSMFRTPLLRSTAMMLKRGQLGADHLATLTRYSPDCRGIDILLQTVAEASANCRALHEDPIIRELFRWGGNAILAERSSNREGEEDLFFFVIILSCYQSMRYAHGALFKHMLEVLSPQATNLSPDMMTWLLIGISQLGLNRRSAEESSGWQRFAMELLSCLNESLALVPDMLNMKQLTRLVQAILDFVLPPATISIKDVTCHQAISRIFLAFYTKLQESLDAEAGVSSELKKLNELNHLQTLRGLFSAASKPKFASKY